MSAARTVIVIGAGGHAKVLLDALALSGVAVAGLTDVDAGRHGTLVGGVRVLGGDEVLAQHAQSSTLLVNGIGSVASMGARRALYERWKAAGYGFLTVIHPSAVIASGVEQSEGVQVMAGAIVQPGARIGANTILNTGARVDHDCVVGAHVHVAPGAILSGGVTVGEATHVGTGAVVIQGVEIGAGCLVAAGAVVSANVADGERVAGVPARRMAA